jgi:hypothetical protein
MFFDKIIDYLHTGGDLIKTTFRIKKINIVLLVFVLLLGVLVAFSWTTEASQKEISNNGIFEDQFIQFSYPTSLVAVKYTFENYTIVDFYKSNDTTNFNNYVGNIRFSTSNLTNLKKVYPEGSLGEYNGHRTWEGTDTNGPYIYIFLSSGDTQVRTLQMNFKSEYTQTYEQILETLKIKKIPG